MDNLTTENMKKLIFILMAAAAFSCGDGNKSSERADDLDDGMQNTEMAEPDSAGGGIPTDTSSTWDRDRDNLQSDTTRNNQQ